MSKQKKIYISFFSVIIILLIAIAIISVLYLTASKQINNSNNSNITITPTITPTPNGTENQSITDNDYFEYKNEVVKAINLTQNNSIVVTITNTGEGGEGSQYIDTFNPLNKSFSSIEKIGDWKLNFNEFYTVIYSNGQVIKTNSKTGKEVDRKSITFEELKPISADDIFSNFEPLRGSDTDAIYDYKVSLKNVSADVTTYYFVVHHNGYDVDTITIIEINNYTGFVTKIESPDWTGDTTYEVLVK